MAISTHHIGIVLARGDTFASVDCGAFTLSLTVSEEEVKARPVWAYSVLVAVEESRFGALLH